MKNPRINQRIRVLDHNTGRLSESVYRIVQVDTADQSVFAVDDSGSEGLSVLWKSCVEATPEVSWDCIQSQVPHEIWLLLSAFEGEDPVRLKAEVGASVLLHTPFLREWILRAQRAQDKQTAREMPESRPRDNSSTAEI